MKQIPCCHCGKFFEPSPRHKNQIFCMEPECRKAKKAAWKRNKIKNDPDYRYNHKLSNQKWAKANPDYWRRYRRTHPASVERNRERNRRRMSQSRLIAEMDASRGERIIVPGTYQLIPLGADPIAKMDAMNVEIRMVPRCWSFIGSDCRDMTR